MSQSGRNDSTARADGAAVVARFPVSTTQGQLWFLDYLSPGDAAQNVALRWAIEGDFSTDAIEKAFRHVIQRHEVLRTRFALENGEPIQEVLAHVDFRLAVVDIRTTPEALHHDRIERIAREDAAKPFDLAKGGLLRATLIRCAPETGVLLIVAHHTVFDGFSIGVLGYEMGTAAAAFAEGRMPDLPDLPLQFADFALWQKAFLDSGVADEDAAYWRGKLAGLSYFELPRDRPRPAKRSSAVRQVKLTLELDFETRLTAAARNMQISRFAFGAAVVSACLHRITGADDIAFGTPIAGREAPELDTLIGSFVNSQVLRFRPQDGQTFADHAAAAAQTVREAVMHQHLPFPKVVSLVNPVRDAARAPLVSIHFNQLEMFLERRQYGAFTLYPLPSELAGASRDVDISLMGTPFGWQVHIDYSPELFDPSTMENLASAVAGTFQQVFENPGLTLDQIDLSTTFDDLATKRTEAERQLEQSLFRHRLVGEVAAVETDAGVYAFVTPSDDCDLPLETLPDLLGRDLATAPRGISVLARMPRGRNGDIDRARLAVPASRSAVAAGQAMQAPAEDGQENRARIARIWADLLGLAAEPGPDANFFSLGGSSLLAVRLVARLREAFDTKIGVAEIYANQTLGALGSLLAPGPTGADVIVPEDWQIEHILTEGQGTPIIAVNDVGIVLATAGKLAAPRPATCIRLFDGKRGLDQSPRSFHDIAQAYADTIRRAQPEGPYLLFGVCVHGNIALEAARILKAGGATISGVIMKDVWEPGYVDQVHRKKLLHLRLRLFSLANKLRLVREGRMSLDAMLGSYGFLHRFGVLRALKALGVIRSIRNSDLEPEQDCFVAYISAARDIYRPEGVDFPVMHVVTRITPQGPRFKPSIGWEDVIPGTWLKTVQISDISAYGGRDLGTAELAGEIDRFLGA